MMRDKLQLRALKELPVIDIVSDVMPFPGVATSVHLGSALYDVLLDELGNNNGQPKKVLAVMSRPGMFEFPNKLFKVGVISNMTPLTLKNRDVVLVGFDRARVSEYGYHLNDPGNYKVANIDRRIDDVADDLFEYVNGHLELRPDKFSDLMSRLFLIKHLITALVKKSDHLDYLDIENLRHNLVDFDGKDFDSYLGIDDFIWKLVFDLPHANCSWKQGIIESSSLTQRMRDCIDLLHLNRKISKGMAESDQEDDPEPKKDSRDVVKRKVAVKIGTQSDDPAVEGMHPEVVKRWESFKKIRESLREDVQKAVEEDFSRLKGLIPGQAEFNTFINHVDYLLRLYSLAIAPQRDNMAEVESILDRSHYGLGDIKDQIYDYLGTKLRNPKGKAPILLFVGPPGVGKTSIGKSIAESLRRPFIRLSLGGVRDEADIRGHRLTYIGAIPGKIIQEILRAGVKNPVFMLDEVDKLKNDFRGDPSSALLEVLDPEQNYSFQDHYVGAAFDLSDVLFICTANVDSNIQAPLMDRMHPIRISGYTEYEKIQIAKQFLIPKQLAEVGLAGKVSIVWRGDSPDQELSKIVSGYTRESGVRDLERSIHQMFSRWGRKHEGETNMVVTEELIKELLGWPKYANERVNPTDIGEVVGLVVMNSGNGDLIYVQAELTPRGRSAKDISQTGGLKKIFREANHNALTVVKNLLRNDTAVKRKLAENILHLSVPDGAISKDGPSAGITMATAIYSELTEKIVKPYVAMTGEITIKGRICAIGGVKEKVLAAHRDGVRELILPVTNRRVVEKDVPEDIKKELQFHYVQHFQEVLTIVFQEEQTP